MANFPGIDVAAILAARDAFEEKVPSVDQTVLVELNHEFHRTIAQASGNEFLQDAYEKIMIQSLWLSRQCYVSGTDVEYTDPEHVGPIVEGHRALCDAIRDRDANKADLLAADHCDLFRSSFGQSVGGTLDLDRRDSDRA
ncbi:FCD domain-containing protein [Microvirga massiliensis]|uniref:FCD domain-containing protein n=1 Tax=Microvirga massiliensis TaxID=1033741 RepID=UPI00062BC0DB|nr:FCD domain-containing protein [Microvirga massiliensis]